MVDAGAGANQMQDHGEMVDNGGDTAKDETGANMEAGLGSDEDDDDEDEAEDSADGDDDYVVKSSRNRAKNNAASGK